MAAAVFMALLALLQNPPVKGIQSFGYGTPGCLGERGVGANTIPYPGNGKFTITCDHAPSSTTGLGLITDAADAIGTDVASLGILLHLDRVAALEAIAVEFHSDGNGLATCPIAIPDHAALVGKHYYCQVLWGWNSLCAAGPLGISSSKGLEIAIQPVPAMSSGSRVCPGTSCQEKRWRRTSMATRSTMSLRSTTITMVA
jgi:hypothetical protein